MFPVVDLMDVQVLEERGDAILILAPGSAGTPREIIVPLNVIDDGPIKKGQRGALSVSRDWARAQGLL
jgi:hypothetical protein